jgi:signal transduction histidine kinase
MPYSAEPAGFDKLQQTARSDVFMMWPGLPSRRTKLLIAAAAALLACVMGFLDYWTGPHVSMSAFYLLPLALSAWFLDLWFALFLAVFSVVVSITGNILNGDVDFTNPRLVSWNGGVQLVSFVLFVIALSKLGALQRDLESRVRERAEALTSEISEREQLQRLLLVVSEREQRRIGQDLHDGLCQHLVGTALRCEALRAELAENRHTDSEVNGAQRIVELIEEGITLSRQSAKGLDPVEMDAAGLMLALEEFAATTSKLFHVDCRFACDSPVLVGDPRAAEQMFRIAQESVRNAIKHGRAKTILIHLAATEEGLELRIEDDGVGFAATAANPEGMGMRIMPHRARGIGGEFAVWARGQGGTVVSCRLPAGAEGAWNERI